MRISKYLLITCIFTFLPITMLQAQETSQEDPETYYERRAREDAAYELALKEDAEDEEEFWTSQQEYEQALKKTDKKAYKAYMKGKRDAYREHASHCNAHCHHGPRFEYRATYYYSNYPRSRQSSPTMSVRVRTPKVRIGLL